MFRGKTLEIIFCMDVALKVKALLKIINLFFFFHMLKVNEQRSSL